MNGMIAFCENPNCGAIFEFNSLVGGPGNVVIEMIGTQVGPCPRCGSMGIVPDGIYEYKNYITSFINGPKESIDKLKRVKSLLESFRSSRTISNEQVVINEIEKISPQIANIAKNAPKSPNLLNWLTFIIAAITLIIYIQQSYFKSNDENKISEMFIQHLLDENKRLINDLSKNAAKSDTLLTKKTGRNDPCPCKSGLKYKKCCGALNKK